MVKQAQTQYNIREHTLNHLTTFLWSNPLCEPSVLKDIQCSNLHFKELQDDVKCQLKALLFFRSLLECKIAFLSEIWQDAKVNWQFKRNESQSTSAYSTLVPRIIYPCWGNTRKPHWWCHLGSNPHSSSLGASIHVHRSRPRQLQVKWVRNDLECPQLIRQCLHTQKKGEAKNPH